jgi:predicted XRE-type DNA-binding protein
MGQVKKPQKEYDVSVFTKHETDAKAGRAFDSEAMMTRTNPIDTLKQDICGKIVRHKKQNLLKSKDLAQALGIDETTMSAILAYKIDRFKLDYLMEKVARLDDKNMKMALEKIYGAFR